MKLGSNERRKSGNKKESEVAGEGDGLLIGNTNT
jgi:hypothetical protein